MTGINPLSLPLRLWGDGDEDSRAPRSSIPHFLGKPDPAKREIFTAGGLVPDNGVLSGQIRKDLYSMMVRLMVRMKADTGRTDLWRDTLEGRFDAAGLQKTWRAVDNPSLPSGYTYLLQFIAHDMVDSVVMMEAGADGTASASLRDARIRPLMLDTLYGSGPDECPHAYVAGKEPAHNRDKPRTRLRIADFGTRVPARCPGRDFMRMAPPDVAGAKELTDALVADARNDFHPIVGQMTLLFAMLHNWVMTAIETDEDDPALEITWREFLCARTITTMIYRAIVEHDVLPRILWPAVHAAYKTAGGPLLGEQAGASLEFAAGAFRFGHAMVLEDYSVNDHVPGRRLKFAAALDQSSRAGSQPNVDWAVDWRHFFRTDAAIAPNLSHRIGPVTPLSLVSDWHFESLLRGTRLEGLPFDSGLALRDFLSSASTGLWSVPALTAQIKTRLAQTQPQLAQQVPSYDAWRGPLRDWLAVGNDKIAGTAAHMSDDELHRLSIDPPLSFFVLFEAAHDITNGVPQAGAPASGTFPGRGGGTLGPLGSIIVAETFYAALRQGPRPAVDGPAWMRNAITNVCAGMGVVPAPLAPLFTQQDGGPRNIDSMAKLVGFLDEQGYPKNLGREEPAIS